MRKADFMKTAIFAFLFVIIAVLLPLIWIDNKSLFFSEEDTFGNYQKIVYKNMSAWDYSINGGGPNHPGQYTVIFPNGVGNYLIASFGLPNDIVQKVFLSLMLLLTFWATIRFMKLFTRNKLIILIGVLFYYFNFYTKSTLFYSAKMYQMILIPLFFTWTYLFLKTNRFKYAVYNFIGLFFFQGIFSNLATAASTFTAYPLAIALYYFDNTDNFVTFVKTKILPLTIYFGLIIPLVVNSGLAYYFFISNSFSSLKSSNSFAALTSPINLILQFRGAWWEFLSSAEGVSYNQWLWFYNNFAIIFISFYFLCLGLYGFLVNKIDRIRLFFLITFVAGVFLSSGSSFYPDLYKWLFNNIPFFYIFREPWAKFTPIMILSLTALIAISLNEIPLRYRKIIFAVSLLFVIIRGAPFFSYDFFDKQVQRWSIPFIRLPGYWEQWQEWSIAHRDQTVLLKPVNYFKRNWYGQDFGNANHPLAKIFGYTNVVYKLSNNDLGNIVGHFVDTDNADFIKIAPIDYLLDQKDIENSPIYLDQGTVRYNQKLLPYFQEKATAVFGNKLFLYPIKPEFRLPLIYQAKTVFLTKDIKGLANLISKSDYDLYSVTYYFDDAINQLRTIKNLRNELNSNDATDHLSFHKISDTDYRISLSHFKKPLAFVFNTAFSKNWQLSLPDKKRLDEKYHLFANGYANSWIIDPEKICSGDTCSKNKDNSYSLDLTMEYTPQKIQTAVFQINILILSAAIFYLIGYVFFKVLTHDKNK